MREEGTDPDHLRAEIMQEMQFVREHFRRLAGAPDHEPRADLIADPAQVVETADAFLPRLTRRMEFCVMFGRRRFVAQEIAVRACVEPRLVHGARAFADRERDRAVRERRTDRRDQPGHRVVGKTEVLAALQDERPEAVPVPVPAAVQDDFRREPVARNGAVARADAAVETVVAAEVREFDESADEDVAPVMRLTRPARGGEKRLPFRARMPGDEPGQFGFGRQFPGFEPGSQRHGGHDKISC